MLPTFQRAMLVRRVRIGGVELLPVTLAQAYCLYAWESPLVRGGTITPADFAVALWTCSQKCYPFESFSDAVTRGVPERKLKRLGRRYRMRRYGKDLATLREWLGWHLSVPPRFMKQSASSGQSAAPWPMIVAVQLMPMVGEDRAWTMPVPQAMAYKIALDNAQGDTSWKSEAEHEQGYANGSNTQSDK